MRIKKIFKGVNIGSCRSGKRLANNLGALKRIAVRHSLFEKIRAVGKHNEPAYKGENISSV